MEQSAQQREKLWFRIKFSSLAPNNGKGMSMENKHVILTPFTSVPATSKVDFINEKREGYVTFNRFVARNMRQICLFFLHNSYRSTWSLFHCLRCEKRSTHPWKQRGMHVVCRVGRKGATKVVKHGLGYRLSDHFQTVKRTLAADWYLLSSFHAFFHDAMLLSRHTCPFVHQGCACKRNFHFPLS